MFKKGQIIVLKYDDEPRNQVLIGKKAIVVVKSKDSAPHWTEVEYQGVQYSVRGSDCVRVGK